MKKTLALFIILLWAAISLAQSKEDRKIADAVRSIKLSGEQYWWDEIPLSKTDLKKNPQQREITLQNLKLGIGNKIKSYVQGNISVSDIEDGSNVYSHYQSSVSVSSNLYLNNIGYYEFQKDKNQYVFFAYLKRSDFWAQEDEIIARIRNIVETAKQMEASKQSDYLTPYYRAYLMSYNITRSFKGDNGEADMQLWLENKLYSILRAIPIRTTVTSGLCGTDKQVDLYFDCVSSPSGLLVEMPSLGFMPLEVLAGKRKVFYSAQPTRKTEEHQINISINPALVANDPEICRLAKLRLIAVPKTISLDFSYLFNLDFGYQIQDLKVYLMPSYGDISIRSVVWILGDGEQSKSLEAFEHNYQKAGTYQVCMIVNGEYDVKKQLDIGIIPAVEEPELQITVAEPELSLELSEPPESVVVSAPVETLETPPLPQLHHSEPIVQESIEEHELLQYTTVPELISYLNAQKAEHRLAWGKLSQNYSVENSWIVISEQDGVIIAILQPIDGSFCNLLNGERITDVFATYRGKAAIYISYF